MRKRWSVPSSSEEASIPPSEFHSTRQTWERWGSSQQQRACGCGETRRVTYVTCVTRRYGVTALRRDEARYGRTRRGRMMCERGYVERARSGGTQRGCVGQVGHLIPSVWGTLAAGAPARPPKRPERPRPHCRRARCRHACCRHARCRRARCRRASPPPRRPFVEPTAGRFYPSTLQEEVRAEVMGACIAGSRAGGWCGA